MAKSVFFISTMAGCPWGGSEELWSRTAKLFAQNHYKVCVLVKQWPEDPVPIRDLRALGASIFYYNPPKLFQKAIRILSAKLGIPIARPNETRLLQIKPDLVVISQGLNTDGLEWMETCLRYRIKYVTIAQAATESNWPSDEIAERLITSLSGAKWNYYVSKATAQLTETQIGYILSNKKIVNNPFNAQLQGYTTYPPVGKIFHLACVGRLEPHAKGQDILIKVLGMKKWQERNLHVNFYGRGTNLRSLERLKQQLGVENISFKGHVSTKDIWKENMGLILPSRFEGLPLCLVEAMLYGRFGIITDVSGNSEVVVDNENAFVAHAPTVELLDEAMERAWHRRNEWEQIGSNAYKYINTLIPNDPIETFYQDLASIL